MPLSDPSAAATSNRVVSTGKDFMTLPFGVCRRSRVSVYAEAGFEVTVPSATAGAAGASGSGAALPARSAFSRSDLRRRFSLSCWIFFRIASLAAWSSSFSWRFFAASLICSFFFRSSLASCVSLVFFFLISY